MLSDMHLRSLSSVTNVDFTCPMRRVSRSIYGGYMRRVDRCTNAQCVAKASSISLICPDMSERTRTNPNVTNVAKSSPTKRRNMFANQQNLRIRSYNAPSVGCSWTVKSSGDFTCGSIPRIPPTYKLNLLGPPSRYVSSHPNSRFENCDFILLF